MEHSQTSYMDITELPPEVLEQILSYCDGRSVLALQNTSRNYQFVVEEALVGKIGQNFWLKRCFLETPRPLVLKALASFQTVVGADASGMFRDLNDREEQVLSHRWRRIFVSLTQIRRKFAEPVEVKRLTRLQNMIKNEVTIAFFNGDQSARFPYRMESTGGPLLYHVQCPCSSHHEQIHLYVFENMMKFRRGIQLVGGKEKIRTSYTVTLPPSKKLASLDPLLLDLTILSIVTSQHHILFTPLHRGVSKQIRVLLPPQYINFPYLPTENRFGIFGKYVGVWLDPDTIKIYKIYIDEDTGNPHLATVKIIVLHGELHGFWFAAAAEPTLYLPVLRSGLRDPLATKNSRLPVFSILSPTTDSARVHYGDDDDIEEKKTTGRVDIFKPKMTPEHDYSTRLNVGHFTRRKSEQNVVIFFNATCIAVLYRDDIWIYQKLLGALLPSYGHEHLVDLECQTEVFFILGTNQYIYLVLFHSNPPSPLLHCDRTMWSRGNIEFEILRKIPLDTFLPDPRLELVHCHFDMDRGRPYIFLSCDLPLEERTAYTFELFKIGFQITEEELEDEFGHLKDEDDPFVSLDVANAFPPDAVTQGRADPWLDALFNAFGIG